MEQKQSPSPSQHSLTTTLGGFVVNCWRSLGLGLSKETCDDVPPPPKETSSKEMETETEGIERVQLPLTFPTGSPLPVTESFEGTEHADKNVQSITSCNSLKTEPTGEHTITAKICTVNNEKRNFTPPKEDLSKTYRKKTKNMNGKCEVMERIYDSSREESYHEVEIGCSDGGRRGSNSNTKNYVFTCHQCGISFPRVQSLRYHSLVHQTPNEEFVCCICNRSGFKTVHHFRLHCDSHKQNFTCDFCGAKFGTQTYLNRHQRYNHRCIKIQHCSSNAHEITIAKAEDLD